MGGSRNLNKVGAVPPLPFPFPSHSPSLLDVGLLKPAKGPGTAVSFPSGVRGGSSRPKTNLMHPKAVRKPLVAVSLNILISLFYVFEEINWRWCRHYTIKYRCHISGVP